MIKIYLLNMVIIFENELLNNNINIIEGSDIKWKEYFYYFYLLFLLQ